MNIGQEQETEQTTTSVKKVRKEPSRLVKYILNHKLVFSLIFALIVVFVWGQWRICKLEKQQKALIETYNLKMDSTQLANMMVTSKAFSWAVRSDMLRNNPDQVQLYLSNIISEPHIKKAFVVDAEKSLIILSSDKKEEGTPFLDAAAMQTKVTYFQQRDSVIRFISPYMGLNRKAGISVIEADFR